MRHESARAPVIPPSAQLDLAAHPTILFEVFGETNDPRMIPVAAIENGKLKRILLSAGGWHRFDAIYLRSGMTYPLYDDGRAAGTVDVRQGMWEKPADPIYTLPGCHTLTPLAAVTAHPLHAAPSFTVEYLATTTPVGRDHPPSTLRPAEVQAIARRVSAQVARDAGIDPKRLDSLDFHAVAFNSGATPAPTIVASFIDPAAENSTSTAETTTHLFVIADRDSANAYHATFIHRVDGPLGTADFRRYVDHLDLTGDGVDEIVTEAWVYGGDTYLSVLTWRGGRWQELYRTRGQWCLDAAERG
jgi:hypothetical protein